MKYFDADRDLIARIESFGNEHDLVERLGMLHHTRTSDTSKSPHASGTTVHGATCSAAEGDFEAQTLSL
jgi:hypothetical protein